MKTTLTNQIAPNLRQEAAGALSELAQIATRAMQDAQTNRRKTGRTYIRRGGFHTASAAGENPAKDTGGLVNAFAITGQTLDSITIENNAVQAARLEDVLNRPITEPATDDDVLDAMADEVLDHVLRAF
jgi:hypothetical protein